MKVENIHQSAANEGIGTRQRNITRQLEDGGGDKSKSEKKAQKKREKLHNEHVANCITHEAIKVQSWQQLCAFLASD